MQYSFHAGSDGDEHKINVARIYDQKYNIIQEKVYKKIDVYENDPKEEPADIAGYTGQFNRKKI